MPDASRLIRQWTLLRLLSARRLGLTVDEMAAELEVSMRTIRRDLALLREAGFPLVEEGPRGSRKRWQVQASGEQPALSFAYDEAIALYMARRLMEPLAGTPFWEATQRAFRKIRASLGDGALRYVERLAGMFHQTDGGASDYSHKAELIDQLMLGIEDRKAVFLTYQSLRSTEPVTYDVYPYAFAYHRGSLYLIGHSPDHDEIRHWKVDRMLEAEATEFPFQRPKDFDIREHLAQSFGIYRGSERVTVVVRFSSEVARYVMESNWHPSQELKPLDGGGLLARFKLSDTQEVSRWILSFGKHAEVLEPAKLRKELAEELCDMGRLYAARGHTQGGQGQEAERRAPPRRSRVG